MTTINTLTTVTVDIPVDEYSHNDASQIFEDIRRELAGNNATHEHMEEETAWEASFYLPNPFDTDEFKSVWQSYADRYPGIAISTMPQLAPTV